jgi:hypothetical protein
MQSKTLSCPLTSTWISSGKGEDDDLANLHRHK